MFVLKLLLVLLSQLVLLSFAAREEDIFYNANEGLVHFPCVREYFYGVNETVFFKNCDSVKQIVSFKVNELQELRDSTSCMSPVAIYQSLVSDTRQNTKGSSIHGALKPTKIMSKVYNLRYCFKFSVKTHKLVFQNSIPIRYSYHSALTQSLLERILKDYKNKLNLKAKWDSKDLKEMNFIIMAKGTQRDGEWNFHDGSLDLSKHINEADRRHGTLTLQFKQNQADSDFPFNQDLKEVIMITKPKVDESHVLGENRLPKVEFVEGEKLRLEWSSAGCQSYLKSGIRDGMGMSVQLRTPSGILLHSFNLESYCVADESSQLLSAPLLGDYAEPTPVDVVFVHTSKEFILQPEYVFKGLFTINPISKHFGKANLVLREVEGGKRYAIVGKPLEIVEFGIREPFEHVESCDLSLSDPSKTVNGSFAINENYLHFKKASFPPYWYNNKVPLTLSGTLEVVYNRIGELKARAKVEINSVEMYLRHGFQLNWFAIRDNDNLRVPFHNSNLISGVKAVAEVIVPDVYKSLCKSISSVKMISGTQNSIGDENAATDDENATDDDEEENAADVIFTLEKFERKGGDALADESAALSSAMIFESSPMPISDLEASGRYSNGIVSRIHPIIECNQPSASSNANKLQIEVTGEKSFFNLYDPKLKTDLITLLPENFNSNENNEKKMKSFAFDKRPMHTSVFINEDILGPKFSFNLKLTLAKEDDHVIEAFNWPHPGTIYRPTNSSALSINWPDYMSLSPGKVSISLVNPYFEGEYGTRVFAIERPKPLSLHFKSLESSAEDEKIAHTGQDLPVFWRCECGVSSSSSSSLGSMMENSEDFKIDVKVSWADDVNASIMQVAIKNGCLENSISVDQGDLKLELGVQSRNLQVSLEMNGMRLRKTISIQRKIIKLEGFERLSQPLILGDESTLLEIKDPNNEMLPCYNTPGVFKLDFEVSSMPKGLSVKSYELVESNVVGGICQIRVDWTWSPKLSNLHGTQVIIREAIIPVAKDARIRISDFPIKVEFFPVQGVVTRDLSAQEEKGSVSGAVAKLEFPKLEFITLGEKFMFKMIAPQDIKRWASFEPSVSILTGAVPIALEREPPYFMAPLQINSLEWSSIKGFEFCFRKASGGIQYCQWTNFLSGSIPPVYNVSDLVVARGNGNSFHMGQAVSFMGSWNEATFRGLSERGISIEIRKDAFPIAWISLDSFKPTFDTNFLWKLVARTKTFSPYGNYEATLTKKNGAMKIPGAVIQPTGKGGKGIITFSIVPPVLSKLVFGSPEVLAGQRAAFNWDLENRNECPPANILSSNYTRSIKLFSAVAEFYLFKNDTNLDEDGKSNNCEVGSLNSTLLTLNIPNLCDKGDSIGYEFILPKNSSGFIPNTVQYTRLQVTFKGASKWTSTLLRVNVPALPIVPSSNNGTTVYKDREAVQIGGGIGIGPLVAICSGLALLVLIAALVIYRRIKLKRMQALLPDRMPTFNNNPLYEPISKTNYTEK